MESFCCVCGAKVVCHNCINEEAAHAASTAAATKQRRFDDCAKAETAQNNAENDEGTVKPSAKSVRSGGGGGGKKRYRSNDAVRKLEAVEWARTHSVVAAAEKFKVDRKVIRDWKANEDKLRQQIMSPEGAKRKRLGGAGRPLLRPDIDILLADWVKQMRANRQPVSRSIIRQKAVALFTGTDVKVSLGWLQKFLKRHNFMLRKKPAATVPSSSVCPINGEAALKAEEEAEEQCPTAAAAGPSSAEEAPTLEAVPAVALDCDGTAHHQHRSWHDISQELVNKSFEVCAMSAAAPPAPLLPDDGTAAGGADEIPPHLEPQGSVGGPSTFGTTKNGGQQNDAVDGELDDDVGRLYDNENDGVQLEGVGDDDELFFD